MRLLVNTDRAKWLMMLSYAVLISTTKPMTLRADESSPLPLLQSEEKVLDKTEINFDEAQIDGKMKVPQGFFLQARQAQSYQQMVRLRSGFRDELKNSAAAVKALAK